MPPFNLMRADRSGTAHPVSTFDDLELALRRRDALRSTSDHRRVYFFVVDADDGERGEADWCGEDCGRGAFGWACATCAASAPTYLVELSDPSCDAERWEVRSLTALIDRLESETGWSRIECEDAARLVAGGKRFEFEDRETSRTITARQVETVGAAR